MKLTRWMALVTVCSLAALTAVACSDEPSAPGGQGGATVGEGTLAVMVIADDAGPIEGAALTLVGPGDTTQELTTDAAGRATFVGLDWAAGTAAVTSYEERFHLHSVVGIRETDGEVEIHPYPVDEPEWPETVTISGTASNMVDETHGLRVSATGFASTYSLSQGPDYVLGVPPNEEVELVLVEFEEPGDIPCFADFWCANIHRWSVAPAGPFATDTTYDVDLAATEVTPVSVAGSLLLPAREDSLFRQTHLLSMGVFPTKPGRANHGFANWAGLSQDTSAVEFTAQYLELASEPDVVTGYAVSGPNSWGEVALPGPPQNGQTDLHLIDTPRPVEPVSFATAHPLHEPFRWEAFEDGLSVELRTHGNSSMYWVVQAPAGATELTVPPMPASVPSGYFGDDESVSAELHLSEYEYGHGSPTRFTVVFFNHIVP